MGVARDRTDAPRFDPQDCDRAIELLAKNSMVGH
jgi:hypothetical protein